MFERRKIFCRKQFMWKPDSLCADVYVNTILHSINSTVNHKFQYASDLHKYSTVNDDSSR